MIKSLNLFTDGGSRGNPGSAACAFVVLDNDKHLIAQGSKYLGVTTNNVAEYSGLIMALEWIKDNAEKGSEIRLHMDSELLVNQINGQYKVKNENLKTFYLKAVDIINNLLFPISVIHVTRDLNSLADALVNKCLDSNS